MEDKYRCKAIIDSVFSGLEDHGFYTTYISLRINDVGYQSFGGLATNMSQNRTFVNELCNVFNVTDLQRLVNKECYALYSLPYESIEGLEIDNVRFTITSWIRKYQDPNFNQLENKQRDIQRNIDSLKSRIQQEEKSLKDLQSKFKNWSDV